MANPPNSGDQLDTGIGGFEIPSEIDPTGRAGIYTYDPGDPDRPIDPDYPERNTSLHGGNVSVDHSKKDLSRTTKLTLGHFLGKSTRGKNSFPIDVPTNSDDQKEVLITRNVDGSTPSLRESENNNTFIKRDVFYGSSTDRWSKPDGPVGWQGGRQPNEEFVVPSTSQIPLSKGFDKPPGTAQTGHTLLPSVGINPGPVQSYTLASLYNNRFDPNIQFLIRDDLNPERPGDKFEDLLDFNVQFSHPTLGKVTTNQMTQIAGILTQNAAGGRDLLNLTETASGYTQKIDTAKLEIDRIIQELPPDSGTAPNFISLHNNGYWGVMNHPGRIFVGGVLSWDSNVIAFLNAAAIGLLAASIAGVSAITDLIGEGAGEQYYRDLGTHEKYFDHPKQQEPGGFFSFLKNIASGFVGFPTIKTENPYWECILRGSWNFFTGIGWETNGAWNTVSRAYNSFNNMHQTLPVSRVVTRAFDTLVNQQGKIDNREEVVSLIKSVFSGKIMDIMNTFATMGDAILERDRFKRVLELTQDRLGAENITDPMVSDFTALHLMKNQNGWGTSGTKSLFLAPVGYRMKRSGDKDEHIVAALPGNLPGLSLTSTKNRGIYESFKKVPVTIDLGDGEPPLEISKIRTDTRIPTNISSKIESELESEYMPFYFHDVRTNEIISFHAFLESLQDSFTSSVEAIDGMGRVEPVKIYKGTQRKVSVSFYVVALNEGEFPIMWEKINKLVTLVYPQYTKGRVLDYKSETGMLNDPSFKFIQPFSQMISASPMIRLRVGNVIRSNYTDEAMEDLFGAADPGMFQPNNEESHPSSKPLPAWKAPEDFNLYFNTNESKILSKSRDRLGGDNRPALKQIAGFIAKNRNIIEQVTLTGRADERASTSYNQKLSERRIFSAEAEIRNMLRRIEVSRRIRESEPGWTPDQIKEYVRLSNAQSSSEEIFQLDRSFLNVMGTRIKLVQNAEGETKSAQKSRKEQWSKDRVVIVSIKMKDRIQPTASQIADDQKTYPTLTRGQLTDNFMNFGENSIIKTFKDTGAGGGLAGFIESLSFEWLNGGQITWDVNEGRKAPKLCKVTLDFSPIHDISPGLGWKGNNRAAVYNFNKVQIFDANNAPELNTVKERPPVPLAAEGEGSPDKSVTDQDVENSDEREKPSNPTPESTKESEKNKAKRRVASRPKDSSDSPKSSGGPMYHFDASGAPGDPEYGGSWFYAGEEKFIDPMTGEVKLDTALSLEEQTSGKWEKVLDSYVWAGGKKDYQIMYNGDPNSAPGMTRYVPAGPDGGFVQYDMTVPEQRQFLEDNLYPSVGSLALMDTVEQEAAAKKAAAQGQSPKVLTQGTSLYLAPYIGAPTQQSLVSTPPGNAFFSYNRAQHEPATADVFKRGGNK